MVEKFRSQSSTPFIGGTVFNLLADGVTALCVATMVAAVVANFLQAESDRTFRERRSPIATASMTVFFLVLYFTIRMRWSMLASSGFLVPRSCGLGLMVLGTAYNIWGRLHLGRNWADQVRIYGNQTLVTRGPYRFVRHPLYASLLWMFYGASVVYLNPLAALEITLVFLPAMGYRAGLEERALMETFGDDYRLYRMRTGRFLPRWRSFLP